MRNRVVVSVVLVLLAGACGKESLPKLPASAAGGERAAGDAAAMSMPATDVTYRFDGSASDLPDKATAYELQRADVRAALGKLAAAFGLSGEVEKRGDSWALRDDGREVGVHDQPGLPWYLGRENPCPDQSVSDVQGDVASCVVTEEAVVRAAPAVPPREQVEAVARSVFESLGLDTTEVEVSDGTAVVHPRVGGRRTVGYEHTVHVDADGEVRSAHGWLGRPKAVGDYPLVGLDEGLERLRTAWGFGPRTLAADAVEPAVAPDASGPQEVVLTGVEVGLQLIEDHLVPAYLFRVGDGDGPTVVAVAERFLEGIAPEPAPVPEPDKKLYLQAGRTCAAMGSASSSADGEVSNQPLQLEVCGPTKAKVGEEVVFEVTAVDPDAEIIEEGCGGPRATYGDEVAPVVGSCMPACAGPPKQSSPGKLARTFRHTYEKPGRYSAMFSFQSAFCTTGTSNGAAGHNIDVK